MVVLFALIVVVVAVMVVITRSFVGSYTYGYKVSAPSNYNSGLSNSKYLQGEFTGLLVGSNGNRLGPEHPSLKEPLSAQNHNTGSINLRP